MESLFRTDLEKAITAHGGPSVVAERLGWKLQKKPRKPRGYWDSMANVKQEIDYFIEDNELQPGEKLLYSLRRSCSLIGKFPEILSCKVVALIYFIILIQE